MVIVEGHIQLHMLRYVKHYTQVNDNSKHYYSFIPLISAVAGLLTGPTPNLLITVTMTTTVPVNTPSGSDRAVNVSVVVELLTFLIVPL